MFTEEAQGLGLVVAQTTKFDPTRMLARKKYWFNLYFREIVKQLVDQYKEAGFAGLGAEFSPGMLQTGKIPGLNVVLNIVSKIPIVGGLVSSIFGGSSAPKIPWGEIYATATPLAKKYGDQAAIDEEYARIAEEVQQTAQIRQTTGEKRSQEAALFKMPEGITSISRGAVVMALKGKPVEVRK